MPTPSSWRELLQDIVRDTAERDRITAALKVSAITLRRWISGESNPRPRMFRLLQEAIPQPQRESFIRLAQKEFGNLAFQGNDEIVEQIDYTFIQQIFETRATTQHNLLFWMLCRKVFQQALRHLDPQRLGMSITVAGCMPPREHGKIWSLREIIGMGTPPWPRDLDQYALFLGAESLAGYAVTHSRQQSIDDLRTNCTVVPAYQAEHEVSAIAHPITYANRIAGCLLLSSTQPRYFAPAKMRSLVSDYTQLIALAFTPEAFYPLEQIELQIMPPLERQRASFVNFQQRVIALMRDAYNSSRPLAREQAEVLVWQQLEEELLYNAEIPIYR